MENYKDTLQEYAAAVSEKVLAHQSDLDPKDHAMAEMLPWCRNHKDILVLQSGTILTSAPASRVVQNCKIVMSNLGLQPKQVRPTSPALIALLLENTPSLEKEEVTPDPVSTQQQRLRLLVGEAVAVEASDIHIEVRKDIAHIRFRKHGELYLHAEWMPKLAREVVSVAFNKETDHSISHFNSLVPQNASMRLFIDEQEVRLRLASLPAHNGFDVVMRMLPTKAEQAQPLEELGYTASQIKLMKKALRMPNGAVIVSGPTGSGKTTTLASCMQMISQERKVYTIEDPVEKLIGGATQVPVNTEHYDRSFASMARTILRMDPDVIVLGEMRDEDTAKVMVRASVTGHLVFSTVHTNSAIEIVTRLLDLGVSQRLLASSNLLVCLVCQRLVPVLCKHCRKPVEQSAKHQSHLLRLRNVFNDRLSDVYGRGEDCSHCHGLGISGRTIVAEFVWMDDIGRDCIQKGDLLGWRLHLEKQHWQSFADQLIKLVQAGRCDPLDAERYLGELSASMVKGNHIHSGKLINYV